MTLPSEKSRTPPAHHGAGSPAYPYDDEPDGHETVVSVFGDTSRSGPWAPPEETRAVAGFGNVVLDFREASLPAGVTEVDAYAIFGNVEICLPASLELELSGVALLGSIVHHSEHTSETGTKLRRWLRLSRPAPRPLEKPADDEAVLSVRGTAIFGKVVVKVVKTKVG